MNNVYGEAKISKSQLTTDGEYETLRIYTLCLKAMVKPMTFKN